MSVLRVYTPAECDEHGVPLDWERCGHCEGRGEQVIPAHLLAGHEQRRVCPHCDGHRSLKAAALAARRFILANEAIYARERDASMSWVGTPELPPDQVKVARCEDCGHPMSKGTWTGDTATPFEKPIYEEYVRRMLVAGDDAVDGGNVHYSPCDEGCRHGGPGRSRSGPHEAWGTYRHASLPDPLLMALDYVEASWRPVDVRCLGEPNDLRPKSLVVLCLRCWAARSAS